MVNSSRIYHQLEERTEHHKTTDNEGPFVVYLHSQDRINTDQTEIAQQEVNALGVFVDDTRVCRFEIDWKSVLPTQYKKFKVYAYFISDECVVPKRDDPSENPRNVVLGLLPAQPYNTSDGEEITTTKGQFMKVSTRGLYSHNVFDTKSKGRSDVLSVVRRQVFFNTEAFESQVYLYETVSSHLHAPIVNYPSQNVLEVRLLAKDGDNLFYPESFMRSDYRVDDGGNTVDLPVLADWFMVLSFFPCE